MVILSSPEAVFGDVLVRPARPGEVDVVLDLLAEAAAWLRSRGIEQWPQRFPAESVRGALLVEKSGRPIATLAVADEDSALWGPDTAPAYYVSRLAVRQHGTGLGYRLIDWVSGKAVEHGRQYVRLATARDNPALRRYYERAGFVHVADPTAGSLADEPVPASGAPPRVIEAGREVVHAEPVHASFRSHASASRTIAISAGVRPNQFRTLVSAPIRSSRFAAAGRSR